VSPADGRVVEDDLEVPQTPDPEKIVRLPPLAPQGRANTAQDDTLLSHPVPLLWSPILTWRSLLAGQPSRRLSIRTDRLCKETERTGKSARRFVTLEGIGPGRIRTCNQGIMSPLPKARKSLTTTSCGKRSKRPDRALTKATGQTPSAGLSEPALTDPDLARIVAAWPNLPEHVKQTILTLAETARVAK
jgi:hypothetical protein